MAVCALVLMFACTCAEAQLRFSVSVANGRVDDRLRLCDCAIWDPFHAPEFDGCEVEVTFDDANLADLTLEELYVGPLGSTNVSAVFLRVVDASTKRYAFGIPREAVEPAVAYLERASRGLEPWDNVFSMDLWAYVERADLSFEATDESVAGGVAQLRIELPRVEGYSGREMRTTVDLNTPAPFFAFSVTNFDSSCMMLAVERRVGLQEFSPAIDTSEFQETVWVRDYQFPDTGHQVSLRLAAQSNQESVLWLAVSDVQIPPEDAELCVDAWQFCENGQNVNFPPPNDDNSAAPYVWTRAPRQNRSATNSESCCRSCAFFPDCPPGPYRTDGEGCCERVVLPVDDSGTEIECPAGFFLDDIGGGTLECVVCPENTYSPRRNQYLRCLPCLAGYTCVAGLLVHNQDGHWCATPTPDEYEPPLRPCLWEYACREGPCGDGSCHDGYRGTLCGTCADGYYAIESQCAKCPKNSATLTIMVVLGILLLILLLVFMAKRPPAKPNRIATTFMLAATHFQTLSFFNSMGFQWPPMVRSLFRMLSVFSFNLDLVAMGPSCQSATAADPRVRVAFAVIVLPLVMPILTLIVLGVVARCCATRNQRYRYFNFVVRLNFLFLTLGYLLFATRSMDCFDCVRLDDGSLVLERYPSVECELEEKQSEYDEDTIPWLPILIMGIVGLALWALLYPCLICCKLRARRRHLEAPKTIARYGVFYAPYKRVHYRWELLVMARKFCLAASVILVASGNTLQVWFAAGVLALALAGFLVALPMWETQFNVMDGLLQFADILILCLGYWISTLDEDDDGDKDTLFILDVVLLLVVMASICLVLYMGGIAVRDEWRDWRKDKKNRVDVLDDESA